MPELAKASAEFVDTAEKAIDKLLAAAKTDIPDCGPVKPDPDQIETAGQTPEDPPSASAGATLAESIVILLDASGSMRQNGRMEKAKASAYSVLQRIASDTEVALIVFYGCGSIKVEQPFTTDPSRIASVLPGIKPRGSTPLAAATRFAKTYIESEASGAAARMVVLTDGKETCRGKPVDAAREVAATGATP
jgi:Ca-activated chloride channel family protein